MKDKHLAVRLVDMDWMAELDDAIRTNDGELRIICPFIKKNMLERILMHYTGSIKTITRFNLSDFATGVSDIESLRMLLNKQAYVRGVRNLHAKLYLFGNRRVMLTSANLTTAAFSRNHELGIISDDSGVIDTCREYFENLWRRSGPDLQPDQIESWNQKITDYHMSGGKPDPNEELGDCGMDVGIDSLALSPEPVAFDDATQAFIKFLGQSSNRRLLSHKIVKTLKRSDCHHVLCYPKKKRPRTVKDGAVMFIARMTKQPNDMRIFGRAIGMKHQEERDNATEDEVKRHKWKRKWPRYIRIHHAEFVAGTLENGVSFNELMETLEADAFVVTQEHKRIGKGNTNPRHTYARQPAVELSQEGKEWVAKKLQDAFNWHGKIPRHDLDELD